MNNLPIFTVEISRDQAEQFLKRDYIKIKLINKVMEVRIDDSNSFGA